MWAARSRSAFGGWMVQTRDAKGRFERAPVSLQVEENEPRADLRPALACALRPEHWRAYLRERVGKALPNIVDALVVQAEKGSISHAKGLIALSGLSDETESAGMQEDGGLGGLLEDWGSASRGAPFG